MTAYWQWEPGYRINVAAGAGSNADAVIDELLEARLQQSESKTRHAYFFKKGNKHESIQKDGLFKKGYEKSID